MSERERYFVLTEYDNIVSGNTEKAIENYEKLYKTVSPEMQRYLGYLLKWFF